MIYFNPKDAGFYDPEIVGDAIPKGAVEISDELYRALQDGHSTGKLIEADKDGNPVLVDRPAPSADQLAAMARDWRDTVLAATDGLVARHRDEVEREGATTLTAARYKALQAYRQGLRDWTKADGFPAADSAPSRPKWLDS